MRLILPAAVAAALLATAPAVVAQTGGTPGIAITTSGPASAVAGEILTYELGVTNTGDTAFSAGVVIVSDALCQAPPTLVSTNGDGSPTTLDPGDRWTYRCQVQTAAGQTAVDDIGEVDVTDVAGTVRTASAQFTTTLSRPVAAVSPVVAVSGLGRLAGTVGCAAARYARASVTGRQIQRVVFSLNGRVTRTLTKPNVGSAYQLRLRTRSLRYGAYEVRVVVTFRPAAKTKPRTLELQFSRCRPRIVRPTFTG